LNKKDSVIVGGAKIGCQIRRNTQKRELLNLVAVPKKTNRVPKRTKVVQKFTKQLLGRKSQQTAGNHNRIGLLKY
jgi:hypothetical protein